MSADDRRRVRRDRSKPQVAALKTWFKHQLARVSAKAKIAEELRYGLNHWDGLTRFLDDGRIELDTNIVERGIRPIVSIVNCSSPRRGHHPRRPTVGWESCRRSDLASSRV